MESPVIDLDMNLHGSPSDETPMKTPPPHSRDGEDEGGDGGFSKQSNEGSGDISHDGVNNNNNRVEYSTTASAGDSSGNELHRGDSINRADSHAEGQDESVDSKENNETKKRGTMSTEDYEAMTHLVESWKDELYMMNVKNSILLDDLVKVGADA